MASMQMTVASGGPLADGPEQGDGVPFGGTSRSPSLSRLEEMIRPVDMSKLSGLEKLKAKLRNLCGWWLFAAIIAFTISVVLNIEEDDEGHVIDENIKVRSP